MNIAVEQLVAAQAQAMRMRPKVGGFPVLAKILRQAGVHSNEWHLPSLQSNYQTDHGPVIQQGTPLAIGSLAVARFDRDAVIQAIRTNQAGESTFAEFLQSVWEAGVIRYVADFDARNVTYYGADGFCYVEAYPDVDIDRLG